MVSRSAEIRHLQALSMLAQELHFGRAANRLGVTQPALSQLIRDLEARVGFRVVERTTRKVLLTAPGRLFLEEADAILLRLEHAVEQARNEAGQGTNAIRIGAILPTTFHFLPAVLKRFRRRFPDAGIHIDRMESPQLLGAVETGAVHVALLRPPRNTGSLVVETLRQETFVAAMQESHSLCRQRCVTLAQIANERVLRISTPGLHHAFDMIDAQLSDAGVDLSLYPTADSTLTALALVSAGDGISLVPSWVVAMPWTGLCFRPVTDLSTTIDLSIAWERASQSPVVSHFIEVARMVARQTDV